MIYIRSAEDVSKPTLRYVSKHVVSLDTPINWSSGVAVNTDKFIAVFACTGVSAVTYEELARTVHWFFFIHDGVSWINELWDTVPDDYRMMARRSIWSNWSDDYTKDALWCPGGYESENYYALEALDNL